MGTNWINNTIIEILNFKYFLFYFKNYISELPIQKKE